MNNQQDRMIRKNNCNITPFVYLSPRLNDQTPSDNRTRVLQRSQMTVRGKDVQLDNHQQCAQGYCKLHRCGGDRIGHDVPSYDRYCIGIEDKWRRGDPEWIDGSGGRCRRDSPHNSSQEDGTKSIQLKDLLGQDEGHQGEEVPEWVKREPACHWGVGCVEQHPWGLGWHCPLCLWSHLQTWRNLLQWERRELLRVEGKIVWLQVEVGLGEQEGKVEVKAWRHGPGIPGNCHVLLGRRRRRYDKRWGKWFWGEA